MKGTALAVVLLVAVPVPAAAQASWHVPGADPPPAVAVPGGTVRLLELAFQRWSDRASPGLGDVAEAVLVGLLPPTLRAACEGLIGYWGADPANIPRLRARPLWRDPDGRMAVVAYRCGSEHPGYRGRYLDERLAWLELSPGGGAMRFIEDPRAEPGSLFLGRFGDAAAVVARAAPGATLLAIPMVVDSDNPCCGGPESSREEREVWLAVTPGSVGLAASLHTGGEAEGHIHGEGGWLAVRHVERFLAEAEEGIVGITLWHHLRETFWPEPEDEVAEAPEPETRILHAGATRFQWNSRALRFDSVAPDHADDEWSRADAAIVRLPPESFAMAPSAVKDSLDALGCRVPQTGERAEPHNVVEGSFADPDQRDWAALCSRGGESAIIVFWGGPVRCSSVHPPTPDRAWLQAMGPAGIEYSQFLGAVDPDVILRLAEAFDGPPPPFPLEHQGLQVAFAGKASGILYCHDGRWLGLQGMD